MALVSKRRALICIGVTVLLVLVSLQLLIAFQLSRHEHETASDTNHLSIEKVASRRRIRRISHEKTLFVDNATIYNATLRIPGHDDRIPDGIFNGIPIYFNKSPKDSTVSCVGENYQADAWMYRSCHFRHFCFDIEAIEYVIVQSPEEKKWLEFAKRDPLIGTSSIMNTTVSLGGLNPKWQRKNFRRLEWFPRVVDQMNGYYELPSHITWIPFHSMAGFNAGHLVWDDFLPIYTLLSIFGFLGDDMQLLLTRYELEQEALWATCDSTEENEGKCKKLFGKFLPAMGVDPSTFSTTEDFRFETARERKSNYVCARYGAAGIAMLTDHGTKAHGWEPKDYTTTHNTGRGTALYAFRNFLMQNLKLPDQPLQKQAPHVITFSVLSSHSFTRSQNYNTQMNAVKSTFSTDELVVHGHVMEKMSVQEQVTLAGKSAIFVTSSGGGAVTATFLPRGASLIIYYVGDGSRENNKVTGKPARLDWDLFNHMSYIRVHWLPVKNMNTPQGLETFLQLIRNELHVISQL
jgi:hypothetical protein